MKEACDADSSAYGIGGTATNQKVGSSNPRGAPLISLESGTCSHFQRRLGFDFRSIRSNKGFLSEIFKTQTGFFHHFSAELHVLPDLVVQIRHIFAGMAHPKLDYAVRC